MIKIICGVYGHYTGGRVIAKDKNSEPFSLSPEREAELVAQGIADYVAEASAPIGFDETPEFPEGIIPIPDYSIDTKASELRRIGELCELNFRVGMTKAEMVDALDNFFACKVANEDEDTDVEAADEAEDDLEAPDFDPAEAVE